MNALTSSAVYHLFSHNLNAVRFNILISLFLALILYYNEVPTALATLWFFGIIIISLARFIHLRRLTKLGYAAEERNKNLAIFLVLTFLFSALWGSTYFIFLPYSTLTLQYVIILIMGIIATASIASLSVYQPAFQLHNLPMFLPVIIYLLYTIREENSFAVVMIIFFWIVLQVSSFLNHRLMMKTLQLNQNKNELIEELMEANDKLAEACEKIEKLSNTDALTKIANRRFFMTTLRLEWKRASRNHEWLSIMLIDMDNLKTINDDYGHLMGDRCIKEMTEVFSLSVGRSTDVIARVGGDEFAMILPQTTAKQALLVAESILEKVNQHTLLKRYQATCSIGISEIIPDRKKSHKKFIDRVDKALYEAKSQGKNTIVIM